MAAAAFDRARRHAASLWQTVANGRSVIGGLQEVVGALGRLVTMPIRQAQEMMAGVWNVLRTGFSGIGRFLQSAAA